MPFQWRSNLEEDAARQIRSLARQVFEGWAHLNKATRGLISTMTLTSRESHAALLASRGLTNKEIAKRMNITVNTVKRYISIAIEKTGAANRGELAKYTAIKQPD